jgi:hypothetical protein
LRLLGFVGTRPSLHFSFPDIDRWSSGGPAGERHDSPSKFGAGQKESIPGPDIQHGTSSQRIRKSQFSLGLENRSAFGAWRDEAIPQIERVKPSQSLPDYRWYFSRAAK